MKISVELAFETPATTTCSFDEMICTAGVYEPMDPNLDQGCYIVSFGNGSNALFIDSVNNDIEPLHNGTWKRDEFIPTNHKFKVVLH